MADPIIPGVVRCMAIIPSATGLPEDDVVNTWAFHAPAATDDSAIFDSIADALQDFYNGWAPYRSGPLTVPQVNLKFYRLGETPPRTPIDRSRLLSAGGSGALPEEVACVMSFYSERNLPRQRGRVFLGPLSVAAIALGTGRTLIAGAMLNAVSVAAESLLAKAGGVNGWRWGIVSQADGDFKEVTAGWVDDAFDTQRSRGPEANLRLTWGG